MKFPLRVAVILLAITLSEASEKKEEAEEEHVPASLPIDLPSPAADGSSPAITVHSPVKSESHVLRDSRYMRNLDMFNTLTSRPRTTPRQRVRSTTSYSVPAHPIVSPLPNTQTQVSRLSVDKPMEVLVLDDTPAHSVSDGGNAEGLHSMATTSEDSDQGRGSAGTNDLLFHMEMGGSQSPQDLTPDDEKSEAIQKIFEFPSPIEIPPSAKEKIHTAQCKSEPMEAVEKREVCLTKSQELVMLPTRPISIPSRPSSHHSSMVDKDRQPGAAPSQAVSVEGSRSDGRNFLIDPERFREELLRINSRGRGNGSSSRSNAHSKSNSYSHGK